MRKQLFTFIFVAAAALSAKSQSTLTLQPGPTTGKDAELFSCVPCGYATRNFGNKSDLNAMAWTNNGNTSNIRSLIQFDLSAIPAGAVITNATLSLYYNSDNQEGNHFSSFFYKNTTLINRVTSAWDEQTVTWNNQPSITTLNQVTLSASSSSTQSYPNINVTGLVQDMVSNPSQSFGFRLKMKSENHFRKLLFASSDHSNAALRPKLVITYIAHNLLAVTEVNSKSAPVQKTSLQVFPNPVQNELNISLVASEAHSAFMRITDITGKDVYNQPLELKEGQNGYSFVVDKWTKGIYFVTIRSANEVINRKIVIQ
ncbi:MAG: DNRLRE domain-containing protein [Bacteroidetes bacterium]|nr:DNRLRE domain-containing protein [Bacteroidota bacterium]